VNFAQLLLPDFSLILCGYLVCRYTALNRATWEQVESLVYYFLFPVLLFQSIVRSPLDVGAVSGLAAGLLLGVVGIALAYSLPWWPGLRSPHRPREHAAAAQVAFRFNSFIALALAERLAGRAGPAADRGADRRLRAAVQRRRGVADGAPCADRLPGGAGAQSADHRHRARAGLQPAGLRVPTWLETRR
jgi:hypothetical protein